MYIDGASEREYPTLLVVVLFCPFTSDNVQTIIDFSSTLVANLMVVHLDFVEYKPTLFRNLET